MATIYKKFILGTKGRMTQIFDDAGVVSPATIVTVSPMTVTQVRTQEADGYHAVQYGAGTKKAKNVNKAILGHTKGAPHRHIREQRLNDVATQEVGATVDASVFAVGDIVTVSGTSKGKGFQGVVKRHGFGGGPRSHGQKNKERAPGSLSGAGRAGGRVAKGMRMAGRMGGERITVKNLKVVHVDASENLILIKGALPGVPGSLIEIRG